VLLTFNYLVKRLNRIILQLKQVDFIDKDAFKDYLLINLQLAYLKIAQYYKRFKETLAYYVAAYLHLAYKNYFN
jgi:hypothetical protein